jgi:hypothetical protein
MKKFLENNIQRHLCQTTSNVTKSPQVKEITQVKYTIEPEIKRFFGCYVLSLTAGRGRAN